MPPTARSLRKAAILVASLETEHADALLAQVSSEQAQALREAVERLGPIDEVEQAEVIEEFFRIGPLVPESDPAGIELDVPLPESMTASAPPDSPLAAAQPAPPFEFLHEAPPHKLVPCLEREHPQTIALVLSHLRADRAAEILAHLSEALQIEVARRLVDLEQTDAEVLREVEQGLQSWLTAHVRPERQTAGVAALAGILGAAAPQARHRILANLARYDHELAERLEAPTALPLSFADLERMDSASLAVVLDHADRQVLAVALAGASPRLVETALERMASGEDLALRHGLSRLAPPRASEIEDARRQLAELARQLELRGEIAPEIRGRLSVAV